MLQYIIPFSLPHLAISVLAAVRPEVGHMTPEVGVALKNIKVCYVFQSQALKCYHCRIIFMPDLVLNSAEYARSFTIAQAQMGPKVVSVIRNSEGVCY